MNTRVRRIFCAAVAGSTAVLLLAGAAEAQDPVVTNSQTAPAGQTATPETPAATPAPLAPAVQDVAEQPLSSSVLSNTHIRFFTDVGFGRPPQEKLPPGGLQASKYSFQIADVELFATSRLSEQWTLLSDILFTSDFSNEFAVEVDRLIIQYTANRYLRVGLGKFNSAIGYYPNQYHRSKFFQTATGRPIMFTDEDNGGVLPVHQVGITAQGEIPSGALGLHYVAEISNGRAFKSNSAEVQTFADGNNGKAVNVGLFVRPDAAPALDAGFSVYRDTIETDTLAKFSETITAVHAVWVTPNFEFLNEAAVLRHAAEAGGAPATTTTLYTQVARRFGIVRPYFRYEYQDVPMNDPVFGAGDVNPAFGVRKAISAGLHVDLGAFAVVKLQYDHAQEFGVWANGAHAQLAVTF